MLSKLTHYPQKAKFDDWKYFDNNFDNILINILNFIFKMVITTYMKMLPWIFMKN